MKSKYDLDDVDYYFDKYKKLGYNVSHFRSSSCVYSKDDKLITHNKMFNHEEKTIDEMELYLKNIEKNDLGQIFDNNFDCYADTWQDNNNTTPPTMVEGDVVMAMTKEQFVKVVNSILDQNQPCQRANRTDNNRCINCGSKAGHPCGRLNGSYTLKD